MRNCFKALEKSTRGFGLIWSKFTIQFSLDLQYNMKQMVLLF